MIFSKKNIFFPDSDSDLEVVFEDTEKPKPKKLIPSANSGVPPRKPLLAQQPGRKRPLLLPNKSNPANSRPFLSKMSQINRGENTPKDPLAVPPRKPLLAQQPGRKRPLLLPNISNPANRPLFTKMSQINSGENTPKDPLAVNSTTTTTNPSVQNKPKPKGYSHLFNKNKPSPIRRQFEVEAAKESSNGEHTRQAISCLN